MSTRRVAGWWGVGAVLLLGCLEPPPTQPAPTPAANTDSTAAQHEATELRAEASALRAEIALLQAQLLGQERWPQTLGLAGVGGQGGNPFTRLCPAGLALVGMRGRSGALVDSVGAICAPLEAPAIPPGSEAGPVQTELELAGGTGGAPYDARCPLGSVSVGMRGFAGDLLNGFRLLCQPPRGASAAPALAAEGTGSEGTGAEPAEGTGSSPDGRPRHSHHYGGMDETAPVGGEEGTAFTRACPHGWVAIGFTGRGGAVIDSLAVQCGPWAPASP